MERDLSAWVSQESVRASTSALSCSQASLLAGPSRPETASHKQSKIELDPYVVILMSTFNETSHIGFGVGVVYPHTLNVCLIV